MDKFSNQSLPKETIKASDIERLLEKYKEQKASFIKNSETEIKEYNMILK
jgi:hypothetical protein